FQAEDGIRDKLVTGVQTCALPILTGNYPGKARTADELRADAAKAFSLIPGRHRFNLHAIYAETGGRAVERDHLDPEHFARWVDRSEERRVGKECRSRGAAEPDNTA